MRVFDVTLPIFSGMPVYQGDPAVSIERRSSIAEGAQANVSWLAMGSHTGTHVDAPAHFQDGAIGVDQLALDGLLGPAFVCDLVATRRIDAARLRGIDFTSHARILFKTRASSPSRATGSRRNSAWLSEDAARLLVRSGVRLLGVDSLSVEPLESTAFPVHRILLDAGIIIVEGLDLSAVPPGEYELVCLPLKIQSGDGAPARVLLRDIPPDRHQVSSGRRRP